MEIKETQVYAEELEMIAYTLQSNYCRGVLKEAAKRLLELEKIAEYYQAEASRLAEIVNGGEEKCKAMYPKR